MKNTHEFNSVQRRQGFTLVEVLVSSFLTLIVMGMLFAVLMGTINAWESGTSRLRSSGDARLALDILKTDLESMVVRQTQYNQEWMFFGPLTENGVTASWLMFFAPSLDREEGQDGDIVALSYRVAYQDPISTSNISPIFGLYKSMVNTTNTFENVLGQTNIHSGYWDGADKLPETNPAHPKYRAGLLAPNVVGFDVSVWVRYINGSNVEVLERFDRDHYVRLSNVLRIYEGSNPTPVVEGGKIESIEVNMTTISDEGMRRYAFLDDASKLPAIVREFGRTHSVRVPINF
ncbi:type II secretion system protein [Kiritimatiellaeota bacterium B1221]|nr:type II secretion system protein [Kiritimatiellaeota bacterium B1221]